MLLVFFLQPEILLKVRLVDLHAISQTTSLKVFVSFSFVTGEKNRNNTSIQFWQQDNHYKEVYSKDFAFQKFDYIHYNPVEAAIVEKGEDYIYSSAKDYHFGKNIGLLKIKFWDE